MICITNHTFRRNCHETTKRKIRLDCNCRRKRTDRHPQGSPRALRHPARRHPADPGQARDRPDRYQARDPERSGDPDLPNR